MTPRTTVVQVEALLDPLMSILLCVCVCVRSEPRHSGNGVSPILPRSC